MCTTFPSLHRSLYPERHGIDPAHMHFVQRGPSFPIISLCLNAHPTPSYAGPASLRLRQLLLPEPAEEARAHDDLRNQSDPEPCFFQTVETHGQVWEDGAGTSGIGRAGASDDGGDGTQNLCAHQGEHDVEASQRLEEDHAEPDTLDRVEGSEP